LTPDKESTSHTATTDGKEGVLVAEGYNETGQRVLLDVVQGQRERI